MRLGNLTAIYRRWQTRKRLESLSSYIKLSDSLIYGDGFNVDIATPELGHIYLETGEDDILYGNYIFETNLGHIKIGDRTYIGGGMLISRSEITIGDDVIIAWGCLIYDHNSHSIYWEDRKNDIPKSYENLRHGRKQNDKKNWEVVQTEPIHICDKAWIGAQCIILKGVTIGEGAVVGAGSVVVSDVEPWMVVAGNPARVIKRITPAKES